MAPITLVKVALVVMAAIDGEFEGQVVIHGDFNDSDEQIARDFGLREDDD